MDDQTADFYNRNATSTAKRYEEVSSPVEHLLTIAFPHGARVLDIGSGSGRDASRMIARGYDCFGVEPSAGLRHACMDIHPELAGRISDGCLPEIGQPFGGEFDGVLCCAVLMHVPDSQLFDSALGIRALLKPHGRVLLSLPLSRGEPHQDSRDANGRLFTPYAPDEIGLLFERLGFALIGRWDTDDALLRAGTSWFTLLLELRNTSAQRPIDQIETILNRDRKEASYKLALFRALSEIATQESRLAVWLPNGEVGIPIQRVAELWLQYFWPILSSNKVIPQSQAEGAEGKSIRFRSALTTLIANFSNQGEYGGLTSWHLALTTNRLTPQVRAQYGTAIKTIASTIRDGPVTHSGGALESGPVFRYDTPLKMIVMKADLWRELCLLGHWIVDAVILRWAALTQQFGYRQGISAGDVLPLLLAKPQPLRATVLARQIFIKAGVDRCTWSNRKLKSDFAVDHVISFSLWGNNDLWNLVPADPKTNGNKSDKLPSTQLLVDRRMEVLRNWDFLRSELTGPFDLQAAHLLGKPLSPMGGWKDDLFSRLREAVELTAIQRGVERWTPLQTEN